MPLGFEFSETMSGTYTRAARPDQTGHIRFSGRARARDLRRHLKDGLVTFHGTLDMEGFADDVPFAGTVEIQILSKRLIRYDLSFVGNDGQPYRLVGQKDIRFGDFVTTMTHLQGTIGDAAGHEIARVTLRFDVQADLLPFLVSWKAGPHLA